MPAPVDEHFPAWEVRPKAGGTAGDVDEDPATAPRAPTGPQETGWRSAICGSFPTVCARFSPVCRSGDV